MIHPSASGRVPLWRFSTDAVPSAERLQAWESSLGGAYTIGAERKGFHARVTGAAVDRMSVLNLDTAPQSVARSRAQIRRDGLEHLAINLNRQGFRFVSESGPGAVAAGGVCMHDLSKPFAQEGHVRRDCIILSLSRELVEAALPDMGGLHASVLSGAGGALFAEHARMLGAHVADLPLASARPLAEATAWMLAAAVGAGGEGQARARPALDAARLLRAKRHIRAHLHQPGLTPDALARALKVSRRTLFALFEEEGGVERYLLNRRLALAADALRDPGETRPVAQVAFANGFSSASHFSRAFRARYGLTPSEMRHGGALELPAEGTAAEGVFVDWLRRLG